MSQDSSVEVLLNSTRQTLQELGDSVENLASTYADIFENSELSSSLEKFRSAHQEATERLKSPRLSIATIGTTSSGKSTIVNALIGRKLAPIEAGEMSGGVLTLRHADSSQLVIESTPGATWPTGNWTDLSDEEIYDRIRDSVMRPYHESRRKKSETVLAAPQVTAFGPLLPAVDSSLLKLPSGLGIEFIDLPGLKSVQDRTNLAVIQERVQKSFSLVALDYMQVDDEHRKRLLEELKEVVSFLRGRTDSMLFILNRVDQRGADDLPLSERLDSLRHEIKQALGLEELPEILPFSARLLYYAQCAYGPGEGFQVPVEKRLAFLHALFSDCAGYIKSKVSGDKDLKRWIRDLEDQVEDGECISDQDLKQLLNYVYEWSGGQEIWNRLSQRVTASFPELVLLPALLHLFKSYETFSSNLDAVAKVRQLEHKEQVEAEQEKISETRKQLTRGIQREQKKIHSNVSEMIEALKENTSESRSRVAQKAEEQGLQGFEPLVDAVNDVEGDLTTQIIRPVRDALINNQSGYEIEESIAKSVPPNFARDLARAYDVASRRLIKFQEKDGCLIRQALKDNSDEVRDLDDDEKSIRKLFLMMRRVLTIRAEFKLQTKAQELEVALIELIQIAKNRLILLCPDDLLDSSVGEAIISSYEEKESTDLPLLPAKFFEIVPAIQRSKTKETKVVGQEKITETYTTGTCFKSEKQRSFYKDKKEVLEYKTVVLPNIEAMAEAWQSGVAKGKEELWDILCQWMTQRLDLASDRFSESVDTIIDLVEEALKNQIEIINSDYISEMQKWSNVKKLENDITSLKLELQRYSRSS